MGRRLLHARQSNNAVSFESNEVKFKLNKDSGQPKEVKTKVPLEVHSTIEEMMVIANATVAERIYKHYPTSSLLRRHSSPNPKKTLELNQLFLELGMPPNINLDTASLSDCMAMAIKLANNDSSKISLIKSNAVKIMSEAKYFCTGSNVIVKDENVKPHEHYGLGISMYTHFTSPIRRYADVIVHRLLSATFHQDDIAEDKFKEKVSEELKEEMVEQEVSSSPFTTKIVDAMSKHLNKRNREAKFAGTESRNLFLAIHLHNHPEIVQCIISDIRKFHPVV